MRFYQTVAAVWGVTAVGAFLVGHYFYDKEWLLVPYGLFLVAWVIAGVATFVVYDKYSDNRFFEYQKKVAAAYFAIGISLFTLVSIVMSAPLSERLNQIAFERAGAELHKEAKIRPASNYFGARHCLPEISVKRCQKFLGSYTESAKTKYQEFMEEVKDMESVVKERK